MSVALPIENRGHFIIGGSSPAGTGELYAYLLQHTEIFLPQPMTPECHFFTREERFKKGLGSYFETYFSEAKL